MTTPSTSLLALLILIAQGCSGPKRGYAYLPQTGLEAVSGHLDNGGGVAYGGIRLLLSPQGWFMQQNYTDVAGDITWHRGTFTLSDGRLSLTYSDGRSRAYYRARFRGIEYWVSESDLAIATTPEGSSARRGALRTVAFRPMEATEVVGSPDR